MRLESPEHGPLVLPNDLDLHGARFERQGSDLLVTDRDGDQAYVQDYARAPVALADGDGARLEGHVVARLAGPLAPGQVAQTEGSQGAEPIGRVTTVDGTATATRVDGTEVRSPSIHPSTRVTCSPPAEAPRSPSSSSTAPVSRLAPTRAWW
ncbi:MAG: hypothetical protein EXQ94_14340 [Alphaproteobacteria bacterium]|nr:hypothetical protein [Alphaproteobacteria bacterium]